MPYPKFIAYTQNRYSKSKKNYENLAQKTSKKSIKIKIITPKPNSHTILAPYIRPFAIRNQKKKQPNIRVYTVPCTLQLAHHSHTQQPISLNQPKFTTNTWPTDFNQQNYTPEINTAHTIIRVCRTGPYNTTHTFFVSFIPLCAMLRSSRTAQHSTTHQTHTPHAAWVPQNTDSRHIHGMVEKVCTLQRNMTDGSIMWNR